MPNSLLEFFERLAPRFRNHPATVGFAAAGIIMLVLLSVSSCRDAPPPTEKTNGETATDTSVTPEACERMVDNLLDALAPGRFAISSDRVDVVNTLNGWLEQCSDPEAFSTAEDDAELRERYLPKDIYALTARERYSDQDAGYVRNVILVKDFVDATLLDERTDLERAVSLFYKVVNSVDLRRTGPEVPEFGPYETAVFGWGTALDRAWLYGMMLRQLRLDAVIIRPRSGAPDNSESLLVGVIIPEEGVYLFDFQLGLPITSPSPSHTDDDGLPLPRNPVTLTAARKDDAVFRQYDLRGAKFPLSADQLADVEVRAIGESSTWSPRLGLLQAALPVPLEIFDGLASSSFREFGIIERLVIAGQDGLWNEEAVGIWDFPEKVYRDSLQRTQEQLQQLQLFALVMEAPKTVTVEERDGQLVPVVEGSKQNLHQARIRHLKGDYQAALTIYLKIRLADREIQGQPIYANKLGADWSAYWASLVHFEQGDFLDTVESTGHSLRSPGPWSTAAKTLQAKSYALAPEPQYREAADVLAKEPSRSPQYMGNQWLVRRWRRLAEGDTNAPAAEPIAAEDPAPADTPQPAPADDAQPKPTPEELPKQTPADLPPAEKPADPRFPENTPEKLPPSEEPADHQDPAANQEGAADDAPKSAANSDRDD